MFKLYRVQYTENGYIGTFEALLGEKTPDDLEIEDIEIKSNKVFEGCLYCPEKNLIIDEIPRIQINKEQDDLTYVEVEGGKALKSIDSLTKEEREKFWDLQDKYDNFYLTAEFVEDGKEQEYMEKLGSLCE